jgi:hypothetical protein
MSALVCSVAICHVPSEYPKPDVSISSLIISLPTLVCNTDDIHHLHMVYIIHCPFYMDYLRICWVHVVKFYIPASYIIKLSWSLLHLAMYLVHVSLTIYTCFQLETYATCWFALVLLPIIHENNISSYTLLYSLYLDRISFVITCILKLHGET